MAEGTQGVFIVLRMIYKGIDINTYSLSAEKKEKNSSFSSRILVCVKGLLSKMIDIDNDSLELLIVNRQLS